MIAARLAVVGVALCFGCPRHEPSSPAPIEASAPRSQPATPEPSPPAPAAVEPPPAVEPTVEPPAPAAPSGGAIDDARGLSSAEVVARWGEPDRKEGTRWTYVFPRPARCTDREIVYVLRMKHDTVASVERSTRQTGKVCEGDFGG